MLKSSDVAVLPEIALQLIQHFDEHFQNRRRVVAADPIELLIDVEQDALDGMAVALRISAWTISSGIFGRRMSCWTYAARQRAAVKDQGEDLRAECDLPDPKKPEIQTPLAVRSSR